MRPRPGFSIINKVSFSALCWEMNSNGAVLQGLSYMTFNPCLHPDTDPACRQSVITMAAEIRKTFPKGTAIIWISDTMQPPLPADIDWWSSDVYRTNPNFIGMKNCDFVEQQMKPLWNKMPVSGDQKWVIVPGAFLDPSFLGTCSEDDYFKGLRNDFACVTKWANSDARVAAVVPFMFSNAPPLKGMASYWQNPQGMSGQLWALMAGYAQKIQAKGFPPMKTISALPRDPSD